MGNFQEYDKLLLKADHTRYVGPLLVLSTTPLLLCLVSFEMRGIIIGLRGIIIGLRGIFIGLRGMVIGLRGILIGSD